MLPLVSVVSATFNSGAAILKTRASLELQDYPLIQWVVVDGASSDDTVQLINGAATPTVLISEPDKGIYDAWNKGVAAATGEWICFLGAGDAFVRGAVSQYVQFLSAAAKTQCPLEFVSSRVRLCRGGKVVRTVGRRWCWRELRKAMRVAHCGALHHRSLFRDGQRFDATYRIAGDYEFLLRKGPRLQAAFLDAITVEMEVGGASDASASVFEESERAKVSSGARDARLARWERRLATVKWKARRIAWY